ncbi:hypothetical protein AGRA3207_005304 [Actinomadura graeca]|uniref:Uncharacterized protein n=1 Tax=Actinomadura graeca TaxID=2750812 RepID=A0ABX8R4X0_9ACTN|nr:hypothetical protein [Actinomadura graeca]QXJ24053.1 hypothetical protein AGRA3207_005304 [Actinomadura graeca]
MTPAYEVIGDNNTLIIVDVETREVIGAACAEDDDPRWWNTTLHGKARRLFVPANTPDPRLDVARRLRT